MKRAMTVTAAAGIVLAVALLTSGDQPKRITDTSLGLSKTSVFDTPAPKPTKPNRSEPGDLPLPQRQSPEEPPVVPHGVVEFLPITLTENQCAECHVIEGEKEPGEATPVPRSHYVDFRGAPDELQEDLVGARYNCVSCHVSPGDNALLVGNTFAE